MAQLKIRTYPDKILNDMASDVDSVNGNLQKLIDDMVESMYAAPGIGLAAPQIGVSKRLIVVDVSSIEKNRSLMVVINPEIAYSEGEILSEEGCLSVPQFISTVKRSERVFIKGADREGNPLEIEGTGLLSRALQHEIDHINGTLFIDRLDPLKKEDFQKTYLKEIRKQSKRKH